jgi:uncharacterized pyridoxamine 5'-phosphate oxidase family protein
MKDCQIFYLATMDGNQPRVRPFGAVCIYDGKLYICANNQKLVSKQMKVNPKVEISTTSQDGRWLRLTAEAVADDNRDARQAMLDAHPNIQQMYKADDGLFEVYRIQNAKGVICSFDGKNETHTF